MELLIAVLIAFGVVTADEANELKDNTGKVEMLIQDAGITEDKIDDFKSSDDYKESIIGLEESDI